MRLICCVEEVNPILVLLGAWVGVYEWDMGPALQFNHLMGSGAWWRRNTNLAPLCRFLPLFAVPQSVGGHCHPAFLHFFVQFWEKTMRKILKWFGGAAVMVLAGLSMRPAVAVVVGPGNCNEGGLNTALVASISRRASRSPIRSPSTVAARSRLMEETRTASSSSSAVRTSH